MKPSNTRGVRVPLLAFLGTFLLASVASNTYLCFVHSPLGHFTSATLILWLGFLFASVTGLVAWFLTRRLEQLQKETHEKNDSLLKKITESRRADIASAALYQSSQILFSDANLDHLLETVMDLMAKVLNADEGSLMLLDPSGHLYIAASRGISEEVRRNVYLAMGERVAGRAAELRHEYLLVDGLENYPEFADLKPNPRIRSSLVCPLVCQNELLGVLNLNRTLSEENFTVADLLNLSIFSSQLAQAVKQACLYKDLQKKAAELEVINQKIKALQEQLNQPR